MKLASYSISTAADVSGLSVFTVDYLCREGVVIPHGGDRPGRGKRRAYSFTDLVLLRAVARLLKNGLTVAHLKKAFEDMRTRHPEVDLGSVPPRYLVTDGKTVFFRNGLGEVEQLASRQLVFAFLIDLPCVGDEVSAEIRQIAKRVSKTTRAAASKDLNIDNPTRRFRAR